MLVKTKQLQKIRKYTWIKLGLLETLPSYLLILSGRPHKWKLIVQKTKQEHQ